MPTARQSGKTIQISQNPFNAGSPADGDEFIGRQEAIESITDFLNTPNQINYLIYGQRRIGKTSLLKRTRDLFTQGIAVYYNLQDKARIPLSQLLFELAGKIQQGVQKEIAFTRDDFDSDNDHFFQKRFLPSIFEQLPDEHSLLILIDEFDVMDDIEDVEDPELTRLAYHQFIPYVNQLTQYSRDHAFPLKLIFAIGRNYKDLNTNRFGQLQKFSEQFELINFSKNECNILIKRLTDHLIPFEQEAFEQLYTYTSGHPFFTQCLAKSSFDMAQKKGLKSISADIVQNQLIPAISSFSGGVLWIWNSYSNRQKVVIYLLAKATNSATSANIDQIEHQANELEFFPIIDQLVEVLQTLLKNQLIRFNEKDQSYNFCVEFIRKWIVMEYQPHDIQKDLMDFIDEDIKFHHNNAKYYFEHKDFEKAVKHYEDIIAIDARRFDALLYAGRCNLYLENIEKAIHYFDRAYDLNPHKTQKDYIKALEIKIAHLCHKADDVSDIIKKFKQVNPSKEAFKQLLEANPSLVTDFKDGPFDYALAFDKLNHNISQSDGDGADALDDVLIYRHQLASGLTQKRKEANHIDFRSNHQLNKTLLHLDRLAFKYMNASFRLSGFLADNASLYLTDGPYNYEKAFYALRPAVLQKDTEALLKLDQLCWQLAGLLWIKHNKPEQWQAYESQADSVWSDLEKLSQQFTQKPLWSFALPEHPTNFPVKNHAFVSHLERMIHRQENRLKEKRSKRDFQQKFQSVLPVLEKSIQHLEWSIMHRQKELEHLRKIVEPPSFFKIQRQVINEHLIEEKPFTVKLSITNKGWARAHVRYGEILPNALQAISGKKGIQEYFEPGQNYQVTYECYAIEPGQYRIADGHLEYAGRKPTWDQFDETILNIHPGKPANLVPGVMTQFTRKGIRLNFTIRNTGDKTARDVFCELSVKIADQAKEVLPLKGEIPGNSAIHIIRDLDIFDREHLQFSSETKISYKDIKGNPFQRTAIIKRTPLEYRFPRPNDIHFPMIGCQQEITKMTSTFDPALKRPSHANTQSDPVLMMIKGIEGTGKTRMANELMAFAAKKQIQVNWVDASLGNSVQKMLIQFCGLSHQGTSDRIHQEIEKTFPGKIDQIYSKKLIAYFSNQEIFEKDTDLSSAIIQLIRQVMSNKPIFWVFENVHRMTSGIESHLMQTILHHAVSQEDQLLRICVTYRPGEQHDLMQTLQDLENKPHCLVTTLGTMSPYLRRQFIQFIIHSPPIGKELMDFLVQWSGNPFYLSELLRLLFHPDNSTYLTCVKGEQHVAVGINLETMLPKTIADVILERMQLELPEILDLAQVLSVAGLEFPELLADTLGKKCFPKRNIQNNIQQLIQAGVLIQKSNHFAFDHQVKQETIYNSLEKKQQQEIYMHLVEILLTTQIYENPQAQQQHLAHYLIHCPDSFQQEHIQKILDAARNAFNQRQFEPAQTFYNALIKQKNLENMDGIECLIERSRLYQLRGWYDQANSDLETAEKINENYVPKSRSEKKQKHQLNIRIKKAMGHNLLKQRSMENADTILLQARREIYGFLGIKHRFQSKTLSYYKDLVEIECDLAACFLRRKEFTKCKQTCEKARKLAMHAENKWPAHSLLHEVNIALGDLYASRKGENNASNALSYYKTALQNTCEDPYYQGQILLKIADVNKKIKQFDEAHKQYTDALTIQKKISNFYGQAMAHAGLGDIYLHRQDYEASRYQWEHVSHLQVDIGQAALKNRCNMALCRIYFYKKLYPRAAQYWWDARTNDLSQTQTDDHLELLETLLSYFQEQGDDEKAYYCLQDLEIRISDERSKKWFETIIQLSDICLRTSRIKEAQTNLEMILDRATDPGIKAQAHERMGDIFAMSHENATEQISENDMDGLEWHYQQAIHFQLMSNNPQHSVKLFNRLIQAMSKHPEDLIRLPQIFQAMMQDLSLTKHFFHREMTETATDMLCKHGNHIEAADMIISMLHMTAGIKESIFPLSEKQSMIDKAEKLYQKGSEDDHIWGLNMLISVDYRLGKWKGIIEKLIELFQLYEQIGDGEGFLSLQNFLPSFGEMISTEQLLLMDNLAQSVLKNVVMESEQRAGLNLFVAKLYYFLSEKEDTSTRTYEDMALTYYDTVVESGFYYLASVALSDASLIYKKRCDYDMALERLNEAIEMYVQKGDKKGEAQSRRNRAAIFIKQNHIDLAISDYEKSIKILEQRNSEWDQRKTYQDVQPLAVNEISQMRADKSFLAGSYAGLANILLDKEQGFFDLERGTKLAELSVELKNEIGEGVCTV